MSTATLISVGEYLATSYRPDRDFVDGQLIERNIGTKDHSKLQREVLAWFRDRRRDSFPRLQDRFDDCLAMGVPNIWVLDPPSRRGWKIVREGHFEALDGVLRTSDARLVLTIADLFSN